MKPLAPGTALRAALVAAFAVPAVSHAVTLSPDGIGQALIYPYYTVQSDNGNSWNTLVTVVNHSRDVKALRVRFREGRNARPVASLNLFLSPNDVWTGALIPADQTAASPAILVSFDISCTSPQIPAVSGNSGIAFNNTFYAGSFADGFGEGLDRTREGFVEIIEMATLTGASAAAVTHNSNGFPANCAVVQSGLALDVAAPTGGLSGTLALIAVNNGLDFNSNAEALAGLATRAFYRAVTDPYPDFNAVEVDPVSTVIANGKVYRSVWTRPVDAVSAVLMRTEATAEYILDSNTRSRTDHVVTLPTRSFYMQGNTFSAPFEAPPAGTVSEQFTATVTDRNASRIEFACFTTIAPPPPCRHEWPWAATVLAIDNFPDFSGGLRARSILGSRNGWTTDGFASFLIPTGFPNGAITYRVAPTSFTLYRILISQEASSRLDMATGQVLSGAHTFRGLPLIVSTFRTFENGTLTCSAGACQGNYGGSFPAAYQRSVTP
jgi:hypothetical protein